MALIGPLALMVHPCPCCCAIIVPSVAAASSSTAAAACGFVAAAVTSSDSASVSACVALGIPSPTTVLPITADAVFVAAIPATGAGDNTCMSTVLVRVAVVPSVYSILYLRVVNATTVPSQTPCSTVCFAAVRPMKTLAHSLQSLRRRPC